MFVEYGIETETKHAEKEKYLGITEKTLKNHERLESWNHTMVELEGTLKII